MPPSGHRLIKFLQASEIFYLFLVAFSFYLLYMSRTGEARTVWEVLHPAFIPTLFIATSLLITILLTSEKVTYKLLFVIVHSVLIHSFFSIIFPAGDTSGQQIVLGRTRLVYDNVIFHGWPEWPTIAVHARLFEWFKGINFQAALSVVFARMFSIDIFWVHLFLVPVLWGVFTPIAAYLSTNTLTQNDKVAVLASLLVSAFPYATYFGAISVPNSLGYIFFFYSLYFTLKNLNSNDFETKALMMVFSFFSIISHYLTGIMSFSLLVLAQAFKTYRSEKKSSSITARVSLVVSLFFCVSLLPLSFIYLRFFQRATYTAFTLDKFYELSLQEIVGLFLLGELIYGFDLKTILLIIIGPVLALSYMIYLLYKLKRNPAAKFRTHTYFLFASFLIILIDYRILKLFMEGLPLNEERLWVFRDFIAVPFVALAIYAVVSSIQASSKACSSPLISTSRLKALTEGYALRISSLFLALNVLVPVVLGGWITFSLSAAYPQVAPLQTTWYELEAVKYVEENTREKYVVIGDIWTIYAGEVIVGIQNPRAYYFGEQDPGGYELFSEMRKEPSPKIMIEAMNQTRTNATIAYFVVTEPRLGTDEFNTVVSKARETLTVFHVSGYGKLYVFSYRKE